MRDVLARPGATTTVGHQPTARDIPRRARESDPVGSSPILTELFGRFPSAFAAGSFGGLYRLVCLDCGAAVAVRVPDPEPPGLVVRCDCCGWRASFGAPLQGDNDWPGWAGVGEDGED